MAALNCKAAVTLNWSSHCGRRPSAGGLMFISVIHFRSLHLLYVKYLMDNVSVERCLSYYLSGVPAGIEVAIVIE